MGRNASLYMDQCFLGACRIWIFAASAAEARARLDPLSQGADRAHRVTKAGVQNVAILRRAWQIRPQSDRPQILEQ